MVRTPSLPSLTLVGMLAYLNRVLSIVLLVPRIAVTWTCVQIEWSSPVLRIQSRIRKDPYNLPGSGIRSRVSRIRIHKLLMSTTKLTGREN